jgi:hypothetical protein
MRMVHESKTKVFDKSDGACYCYVEGEPFLD